jgi:hypothetical protein
MRSLCIRLSASFALLFSVSGLLYGQSQTNPTQAEKNKQTIAVLTGTSSLWRDPGEIESLNLLHGASSPEHGPGSHLVFVKEDTVGATPKFEVVDEHGVHWKVKLGKEAQSETAATRLLWAAGYFVDRAYYLPEIRVEGLAKLTRGKEFVNGNVVRSVRLEPVRKPQEFIDNWRWSDTPFTGMKEMNGLRIMMALMNNWDVKSSNNAIYAVEGEAPRFVVSDLGATFGKTGGALTSRTKSDLEDYAASKFIDEVDGEKVDLTIKSRPFFLLALDPYHYEKLNSRGKVADDIPRADARWLGGLLGRLSIEQIRDCFRAAGYSSEEVIGFADVVARRIAELNRL